MGRQTQYEYPGGFIIKKQYDALGYLTNIKDVNNQPIWQLTDISAVNEISQFSYGNGISTTVNRNSLHYLTDINFGGIHQQQYDYDVLTGNLKSRQFNNFATSVSLHEKFTFDGLDRLKKSEQFMVNGQNLISTGINNLNFDAIGNIQHKDDAGDYVYNLPAKPYNLTGINNPVVQNISLNTLNAQYTDFKKVGQLSEMGTNKQMDFTYGTEYERIKVDYSVGGVNVYTRYYAENYDRHEAGGTYKEWNYIYAPSGLAAIYYNNNGAGQLMYSITDHLGSPILLTGQNQQVIEEYSFDAWGRRRNPTDWSYNNVPAPQKMIRGFTMHEHIEEFALINMNGRVYDPVLGRFIQPDNFIQSPSLLQNFNRYSYCLNNPLKMTDQSGYAFGFDDVAGMLIGGVSNVVSNWDAIMSHQYSFGAAVAYFAAGALGGEVCLLSGGFIGFTAGGTFNMVVADLLDDDVSLKTFVAGGLSALNGGEAGIEVKEAVEKAAGKGLKTIAEDAGEKKVEDVAKSGLERLLTKGGEGAKFGQKAMAIAERGLYNGLKNVLSGYASGELNTDENGNKLNNDEIWKNGGAAFTSGFAGSLMSEGLDKILDVKQMCKGAKLNYFLGKGVGMTIIQATSMIMYGSMNSNGDYQKVYEKENISEGALLIYLSIIKW